MVPAKRLSLPAITLAAALAAVLTVGLTAPAADARTGSVRRVSVPLREVAGSAPARARAVWRTLLPVRTGRPFSLVGLHWRGSSRAVFEVRTRRGSRRFGPWQALVIADAPAAGEARIAGLRVSEPAWVGRADVIQVRVRGRVARLTAVLVDPGPDPSLAPSPVVRAASPAEPTIVPRAGWGADESIRTGAPKYAPRVQVAFLHHTATPNGYKAAQVPAIIRSIYLYHVRGNRWSDLGYSFLIDAAGKVYEGRFGGVGRNVIGAHTGGFNGSSIGVALIGDFGAAAPSNPQVDALERLLAWRLDVAHADPGASVTLTSEGNERFKKGDPATFAAISGHRDAGHTDCPGAKGYALLPAIRAAVAAVPGPRIYEPVIEPGTITVSGAAFTPIRFRARLRTAGPWRVDVETTGGASIARFDGAGATVDATWTGTVIGGGALPKPELLRWRISAGGALPADGLFDGSGAAQGQDGGGQVQTDAIANLTTAPPVVSNDGDGHDDTGAVSWQQVKPATVRVSLTTAAGQLVGVLREAAPVAVGPQSVPWSATNGSGQPLASGHYRFLLEVQPAGAALATATVPVDVRRQVNAFTVTPAALSPNGDGNADYATYGFTRLERGGATIRLIRPDGAVVVNIAQLADEGPGQFHDTWGGGHVADGHYLVELLAPGEGGPTTARGPIVIDTTGPTIRVRQTKRAPSGALVATLRISEPGTIDVRLAGKILRTITVPKAGILNLRISKKLLGARRAVDLIGHDALGNTSRKAVRVALPRR